MQNVFDCVYHVASTSLCAEQRTENKKVGPCPPVVYCLGETDIKFM